MPSAEQLKELQNKTLEEKIQISTARIIEWYETWEGQVYVSFSGGKDSTVLLDLVRRIYPDVPAVFVNTGLEYPELRHFVQAQDNTTIVYPKMRFDQVISTYGYPLISKEVGEAIYYARRLGGGKTPRRKQTELLGQRWDWKRTDEDTTSWEADNIQTPRTWGNRPNCSRAEYWQSYSPPQNATGALSDASERRCL